MKKLIVLFSILSTITFGAELSVKLGLDPFRDTDLYNSSENAGVGLTIGGETTFINGNLGYGFGIEARTETNHDNESSILNYYSSPIYLLGKYYIKDTNYYLLGRVGGAIQNKDDILNTVGKYFALGLGKSIGNYDFEVMTEVNELRRKENIFNSGLFEDNNLQTISFKIGYVFGRETKEIKPVKIEEIKPVVEVAPTVVETKPVVEVAPTVVETKPVVEVAPTVVETKPIVEVVPTVVETKPVVEVVPTVIEKLPMVVNYKGNETILTADQKDVVNTVVNVLKGKKGTLYVSGYTDDSGSDAVNLILSQERAKEVSAFIKEQLGNNDIKIIDMGKGETDFLVANDVESNRKLNRRVQFKFISDSGNVLESEGLK